MIKSLVAKYKVWRFKQNIKRFNNITEKYLNKVIK